MRAQNPEEILVKMASLLEEAGVLEQTTSSEENTELNAMAGSIMAIADQLDSAGAEIAAARLDDALGKLAETGCQPQGTAIIARDSKGMEKDIVLKAAATTLIRISDRLDELDIKAARDIDRALAALAGKCMCPCPRCANAHEPSDHCGNVEMHCYEGETGLVPM